MNQLPPAAFSAHEYFDRLIAWARRARDEGNYAIAAALAIRYAGIEIVTFGANSVFGDRSPWGHAEMNAIMAARSLAAVPAAERPRAIAEAQRDGSALLRQAPDRQTKAILYATLEPCPMCTVCIISAGIDQVVVAAEDPPSGTLAAERLARLPEVWPQLGMGLEVLWAQSDHPREAGTYVPQELRCELADAFSASRASLDAELGQHGALDIAAIGEGARRSMSLATHLE